MVVLGKWHLLSAGRFFAKPHVYHFKFRGGLLKAEEPSKRPTILAKTLVVKINLVA
jgi:hypothetical protein